jgi:hypothetical protein
VLGAFGACLKLKLDFKSCSKAQNEGSVDAAAVAMK